MKKTITLAIICLTIALCKSLTADTVHSAMTPQKVFHNKTSAINTVIFSPDGKYFLTGGDYTSSVKIWQTKNLSLYKEIDIIYKYRNLFPVNNRPHSFVDVVFTPDSKAIYAGFNNGMSAMVSLDTSEIIIYDFDDNYGSFSRSAISQSGNILALDGSYLDIANNKLRTRRFITQTGLAITHDDKYLIVSAYRSCSVHIADIATGKWTIWTPKSFFGALEVSGIDVSSDDDTIAAWLRNGDVRLYSIRQNKEIGNLPQGGRDVKARFSPDGKMLASASDNNKVKLWDVASQSRINTWKTDDRPNMIKWLRGTPWIAIGTNSGELIVASTETKEAIFKGRVMENRILDMDYLPTERLLLLCDKAGNIFAFKIQ